MSVLLNAKSFLRLCNFQYWDFFFAFSSSLEKIFSRQFFFLLSPFVLLLNAVKKSRFMCVLYVLKFLCDSNGKKFSDREGPEKKGKQFLAIEEVFFSYEIGIFRRMTSNGFARISPKTD